MTRAAKKAAALNGAAAETKQERERPRFKVASNSAHILNMNVRREGPEDERVVAVDLKLMFPFVQWTLCDYFDPALAAFLWRGDVDPNAHAQTNLIQRNAFLAPVSYGHEIEGARLEVGSLKFADVTAKKFSLEPKDSGVFNLTLTASFLPSDSALTDLAHAMARETASVLLEEPADLFSKDPAPPPIKVAKKAGAKSREEELQEEARIGAEKVPTPEEAMYASAVETVRKHGKVSTSIVQRSLSIGYARASDLIARMELEGIAGPPDEKGVRPLLEPRPVLTLKRGKKGQAGTAAG